MRVLILFAALAACAPSLAPGETRCTTATDILGVTRTRCFSERDMREAQAATAAPAAMPWWCATAGLFCSRSRDKCTGFAQAKDPGAQCGNFPVAHCKQIGAAWHCYATQALCGPDCVVMQH